MLFLLKYSIQKFLNIIMLMTLINMILHIFMGSVTVIEKKNINEKNYLYATWSKKNGWMVSPDQKAPSNKAKLLLNAEWTTQNIPKMQAHENNYEYQKAPNIIELDDSEKFKDSSGNPVDIETRGDRNSKDIYFSAKDVSRVFELESIERTLLNKDRGYIINTHYKTFISMGLINDESQPHKQLFITYIGMLKILFSSRSGNPSKFIEWAADTLFTVQMGTVTVIKRCEKSVNFILFYRYLLCFYAILTHIT